MSCLGDISSSSVTRGTLINAFSLDAHSGSTVSQSLNTAAICNAFIQGSNNYFSSKEIHSYSISFLYMSMKLFPFDLLPYLNEHFQS